RPARVDDDVHRRTPSCSRRISASVAASGRSLTASRPDRRRSRVARLCTPRDDSGGRIVSGSASGPLVALTSSSASPGIARLATASQSYTSAFLILISVLVSERNRPSLIKTRGRAGRNYRPPTFAFARASRFRFASASFFSGVVFFRAALFLSA